MRRFSPSPIVVLLLAMASSANAQTVVELTDGPVAMSSRVTGMGGAFVGIAEGADGQRVNPASFGTRYPFTRNDVFDWDFTFYRAEVPTADGALDLSGPPGGLEDASVTGVGIDLKVGIFGVGVHVYDRMYRREVTTISESGEDTTELVTYSNTLALIGFAWAIPWIDTTFGIAPTVGAYDIQDAASTVLSSVTGSGWEAGFITAPRRLPFRIGGSYRAPFTADFVTESVDSPLGTFRPDALEVPRQFRLGASYMLGERVYNPERSYGFERHFGSTGPDEIGRRYILFAADTVATGPSEDAVGMQSFLNGQPLESGESWSIAVHTGVESEFLADWMRARAGFYWEPSRIPSISGRHHGTAGFDLKLPASKIWRIFPDLKLQLVADIARDYSNVGGGLGLWY